jgi:exosortase
MSSAEIKEDDAVEVVQESKPDMGAIIGGVAFLVVFVLSYLFAYDLGAKSIRYVYDNTFVRLFWVWKSPDYQHGFLVIPFSIFLLWYRRDMMKSVPARGSWWGLAFFGIWAAMRLFSSHYNVVWLHEASLVPGIAGVVLFVGGWETFLWAWPSIVFLIFMIPLPGAATDFFSQPLQRLASASSAYALQTMGIPVTHSDVVINLRNMPLNVAEACSGIRMLMLFFALCTGAAFILKKNEWWERVGIVVSAIPIAVIANITRLTLIAMFCSAVSKWPYLLQLVHGEDAVAKWPSNLVGTWPHDLPGLLMMPIGMLLLFLEWVLYTKLFVEEPADKTVALRGATRGLLPMAPGPRTDKKP